MTESIEMIRKKMDPGGYRKITIFTLVVEVTVLVLRLLLWIIKGGPIRIIFELVGMAIRGRLVQKASGAAFEFQQGFRSEDRGVNSAVDNGSEQKERSAYSRISSAIYEFIKGAKKGYYKGVERYCKDKPKWYRTMFAIYVLVVLPIVLPLVIVYYLLKAIYVMIIVVIKIVVSMFLPGYAFSDTADDVPMDSNIAGKCSAKRYKSIVAFDMDDEYIKALVEKIHSWIGSCEKTFVHNNLIMEKNASNVLCIDVLCQEWGAITISSKPRISGSTEVLEKMANEIQSLLHESKEIVLDKYSENICSEKSVGRIIFRKVNDESNPVEKVVFPRFHNTGVFQTFLTDRLRSVASGMLTGILLTVLLYAVNQHQYYSSLENRYESNFRYYLKTIEVLANATHAGVGNDDEFKKHLVSIVESAPGYLEIQRTDGKEQLWIYQSSHKNPTDRHITKWEHTYPEDDNQMHGMKVKYSRSLNRGFWKSLFSAAIFSTDELFRDPQYWLKYKSINRSIYLWLSAIIICPLMVFVFVRIYEDNEVYIESQRARDSEVGDVYDDVKSELLEMNKAYREAIKEKDVLSEELEKIIAEKQAVMNNMKEIQRQETRLLKARDEELARIVRKNDYFTTAEYMFEKYRDRMTAGLYFAAGFEQVLKYYKRKVPMKHLGASYETTRDYINRLRDEGVLVKEWAEQLQKIKRVRDKLIHEHVWKVEKRSDEMTNEEVNMYIKNGGKMQSEMLMQ